MIARATWIARRSLGGMGSREMDCPVPATLLATLCAILAREA